MIVLELMAYAIGCALAGGWGGYCIARKRSRLEGPPEGTVIVCEYMRPPHEEEDMPRHLANGTEWIPHPQKTYYVELREL